MPRLAPIVMAVSMLAAVSLVWRVVPQLSAQVSVLSGVVGRLAAGNAHTCGIDPSGAVWCWGENSNGKLGDATFLSQFSNTPRRVTALPGGRTAELIAAGEQHTCVVASDGTVWCWGDNSSGQLGLTGGNRGEPTQVPSLSGATMLGAGGNSTCVGLSDGTARCWGDNSAGQWGSNAQPTMTPSPGTLAVVTGITATPGAGEFSLRTIDAGSQHVCATATDGTAWCWGSDADGRLGSSATGTALVPRGTAALGALAEQISAGFEHSCVALVNGTVSCFGRNRDGEIGVANSTTFSNTPTVVAGLSAVTRVAAGRRFTCVVNAGQVSCFGLDSSGQLGDGAAVSTGPAPRTVSGISGTVVDISVGGSHACAVDTAGDVWCWGLNDVGQLGLGHDNDTPSAVRVTGLTVGTTTTTTTTTTTSTTTTTTPASPQSPATQDATSTDRASTSGGSTTTSVDVSPTVATRAVAAPSSTSKRRVVTVKRNRSLTAAKVARAAGLAIPKKSQGTMRISIMSGRSSCRFVGSTVRGVTRGSCSLKVVLIPKKGRTVSRTVTVRVT